MQAGLHCAFLACVPGPGGLPLLWSYCAAEEKLCPCFIGVPGVPDIEHLETPTSFPTPDLCLCLLLSLSSSLTLPSSSSSLSLEALRLPDQENR